MRAADLFDIQDSAQAQVTSPTSAPLEVTRPGQLPLVGQRLVREILRRLEEGIQEDR